MCLTNPSHQCGLAMIEFVLVASAVFLPLFLGVIDVGLRYYQHNTLTKAVHDASRYYAMNCASQKHGTSVTGAYGGALAIMGANIEALNVSFDQSVVDSLSDRTDVRCLKYNSTTGKLDEFGLDAGSCDEGCEYVEFSTPKAGKSFNFPFWQDKSTIVALSPIMR